jgi:hypothetical protein
VACPATGACVLIVTESKGPSTLREKSHVLT